MATSALAPVAIAAPILVACLLLATGRWLPRRAVDAVATAAAVIVVGLDVVLLAATGGGRVVTWTGGWTPASGVGITLVADGIGAGAALVAAVLVVAGLVFSWRYLDAAEAHFHALILIFLAGMTGFALSGDLFDMFVFFELMGAVAYALTGFHIEDPQAVQGGLAFGVVNSLGAYVTLFGIGLLYARTGALGLAPLAAALATQPRDLFVVVAATLVVVGFLVKGALVPFHFWLDDAHAVAPTPVCVLFSGIMVELGLYGAARVGVVVFGPDLLHPALEILGAVTAVVGAVMCLAQRHLKRLLAYSTIGHAGLFAAALSSPDPVVVAGGALYALAHAGTKSALFLMAGVILSHYGSVDEIDLHGRGRGAVLAPCLMLLAGLSLAGLPPLGPGLGKAIAEEALGGPWLGLFVFTSALTGAGVLRAALRIYFGFGPAPEDTPAGPETTGEEQAETGALLQRVPLSMLVPIVVLLGAGLAVGFVPGLPAAVGRAATSFLDAPAYLSAALSTAPDTTAGPGQGVLDVGWTGEGVLLDLLAVGLACGIALLALEHPRLPSALTRPPRWIVRPLAGLRTLHSGHVGDYAAWLLVGVAVLGACTTLPVLLG